MHPLDEYVTVGTKRLRCGYTTGTCATAATRAAAELLLRGELIPAVTVDTPAGIAVLVEIEEHELADGWAECAVRKDSGDDPDVTNGALVYARVEYCAEPGVRIEGGLGVGRVTREGLDQPVGQAAINSVPRRMIEQAAHEAIDACRAGELHDRFPAGKPVGRPVSSGELGSGECGCEDGAVVRGLLVTISIPAGVELAQKTFNPRLGIEGGISVLGTSGIVRPMSEDALISSIELELRTLRVAGASDVLVVPGNYGRDFACGQLNLNMESAVSCSNYFGATIDAARMLGFDRMLIVGHIGKMAKVAGGVMNTHSRVADCRVEVLAAHAALVGAPREAVGGVMRAATTDAALDVLAEYDLVHATMASLMASLKDRLDHRAGTDLQIEAIVFSNVHGVLGETPFATDLSHKWLAGE